MNEVFSFAESICRAGLSWKKAKTWKAKQSFLNVNGAYVTFLDIADPKEIANLVADALQRYQNVLHRIGTVDDRLDGTTEQKSESFEGTPLDRFVWQPSGDGALGAKAANY